MSMSVWKNLMHVQMVAVLIQKEDINVSVSQVIFSHQMAQSALTTEEAFATKEQSGEDVKVVEDHLLPRLTAVVQWVQGGGSLVRLVLGGVAGNSKYFAMNKDLDRWVRT